MAGVTDPHDPERYAYLAQGNAQQARKRVAADVLLRDPAGRVLLVDPTYKDYWDLPGGMAEANEPPKIAARREIREELGIDVVVQRLLLVDWVGPHGPWDDQLVFVFDGGTLNAETATNLAVADPEIAGSRFVTIEDSAPLMRPDMHDRLQRARQALDEGNTAYDEFDRSW